ncbi:hypothetical protein IV203_020922 [Nitzschia inconspicua]|uniref:SMP-LTD domain-containing protein n=1 Tax=Nitzschia inconspicua TaxID=303405 RepID=A0A9K3KFW8_9STRA|nr:hypothetical protein IV203_020922 [Nitzschia inconspicua]
MLFPERKTVDPPNLVSSLNGRQIRYGIIRSLQPLHELYPLIVPELSNDFPTPVGLPYSERTTHLFSTRHQQQQRIRRQLRLWKRLHHPAFLCALRSTNNAYSLAATSIPMTAGAGGTSFFKYLLVFTAGGLFFSTVIAMIYAVYGLGMENVKRIFDVLSLVLKRVWISFTVGLGAAKLALLDRDGDDEPDPSETRTTLKISEAGDGADPDGTGTGIKTVRPPNKSSFQDRMREKKTRTSLRWRKAWTTLKEQLVETGRTATQGVRAMRQERTLYTALVGQRGLVPIQYAVAKLMPYSVSTIMENALRDTLKSIKPSKAIKKMTLKSFKAGKVPPTFLAARAYDVENCIAIDFDIDWVSEVEASFDLFTAGGLAKLPVSIKSIDFSGVVRVVLTPLRPDPPGYGATLISFPTSPQLSLDVKVLGGELTKLPFLKKEIASLLQKSIKEELLWPRRNVVPMLDKGRQILSNADLQRLREIDPFLTLEQTLVNSNEPIVKDIRERLLPTQNDLEQPIISLLEDLDGSSNSSNITSVSDTVSKRRNNWFGRFNRGEQSEVLSGDAILNVTKLPDEEELKNQTNKMVSNDNPYSIDAQISTIFESISKFLENLIQNIVGEDKESKSATKDTDQKDIHSLSVSGLNEDAIDDSSAEPSNATTEKIEVSV